MTVFLASSLAPFALSLLAWVLISLLDAVCKGSVAARYAPSTDVPWHQAPNFWSDTHPGLWKWRNVLAVISVSVLSVGGWLLGPRFSAHFASMFVLEFAGYWMWIALLKRWIPQKQWFGEYYDKFSDGIEIRTQREWPHIDDSDVWRKLIPFPDFGQLPADPAWLPGWYRFLGLHRWPMIGLIVAVNAAFGVLT